MQNSMLNLACSSVVGRWWISALGMFWFVPTFTDTTWSGLMSCFRISASIVVMPGWVNDPDGCGLMETPGSANVQGFPSLPRMAASS